MIHGRTDNNYLMMEKSAVNKELEAITDKKKEIKPDTGKQFSLEARLFAVGFIILAILMLACYIDRSFVGF